MVGAEVGGAVGGAAPPAAAPALAGEARFIQLLTADFRHLSLETRKKHPQIREVFMIFVIQLSSDFQNTFIMNVLSCMKLIVIVLVMRRSYREIDFGS